MDQLYNAPVTHLPWHACGSDAGTHAEGAVPPGPVCDRQGYSTCSPFTASMKKSRAARSADEYSEWEGRPCTGELDQLYTVLIHPSEFNAMRVRSALGAAWISSKAPRACE